MAMTPAERAALVADIAAASASAVHGQRIGATDITIAQALQRIYGDSHTAQATASAVHGQRIGRSDITIGMALESVAGLSAKVAALTAMLQAGGSGLDAATLQRIADQAAAKALAGLGDKLTQE